MDLLKFFFCFYRQVNPEKGLSKFDKDTAVSVSVTNIRCNSDEILYIHGY